MTGIYRVALRLLPDDVRARHGDQMSAVFAELVRDARRRGGVRGVARSAASELIALLWFVWCERRGAPLPRRIDERMLSWRLEPERTSSMLPSLLQDLRYAARMLARTPGFTLVCVLTMALAIGANTAIFSIVNGVLLRPLPYPDPDRIVVLGHHTDGGASLDTTTPGNFYDWQARATAFESMAAFSYTERIFTWNGNAERILGAISAGSIFDVLGRTAARGRTFTAAEDGPNAEWIVVLSDGLARRMFGEQPAVGRTFGIGGIVHTVIGVMPPDFTFPDYDAEYWVPARYSAEFRSNRDQYFLQAVARLRPDVPIEQARSQLNTVMDAIRRDHPQFTQNATAGVMPMKELLIDGVRTRLLTLMGAVAFILLISCANLGNLLLARASTRRREVAIRHALGARPLRLVRQMLTESVLLSVSGGLAGFGLGLVLLDVLLAWLPDNLPRANEIGLDPAVLAFTAAVSVLSGVAFGFFPALQLASRAPMDTVREGARGSGRSRWVRTTLVVSEVALALMLLTGAGLLVRSFAKLLEVNPGFRSDRLLTFSVNVPATVYKTAEQRTAFFEAAAERLRTLPGVTAVALATTLPVTPRGNGAWFNMLDRPTPADRTPPSVSYRVVSTNYFSTLGMPLVSGRHFTDADRLDGTRAVIVSRAVVRRYWPNADPIGKQIYLGAPENRLFPDATVVGVVADVKLTALDSERAEVVYVPHRLMPTMSGFAFALRTSMDPLSVTGAARAQLRQLDSNVPIVRVRTMDEVIARSVAPARSSMLLVSLFAALALMLAVIGVFGVLSYTVNQRTTELGIRLALGASASNVQMLVLGQGMMPVAAGVMLGLAGAFALTRFMESLLFGVTAKDPITFGAVSVLLAVMAAVASYLPARRATCVDPVAVLRQA